MAADGQFTSFRIVTEDLPVEDMLAVLREAYGKTILKADLEPVDDSPVQMDMRVRLLPGIGIATGTASPIKVGVKSEMIENDDIILLAALAGGSHMQIGKQEEIETVEGKEIKRVKDPKMPAGEREYFRELIALIENRNKPYVKAISWLWRSFAIWQDYVIPPVIAIIVYLLYVAFLGSF